MKLFYTCRILFVFLCVLGCVPVWAAGKARFANAPAGLAVTPASNKSVVLTWTDLSSDETGFRVERKLGAGGVYVHVEDVGANVTRYKDSGLSADVTYYYRVQATHATAPSAYSSEVSILLPDPTIPQAVKVSRDGREPGVSKHYEYALSALTEGSSFPVFPNCDGGNHFVGWQLYYDLGDFNTQANWTGQLQITLLQNDTELWTKDLQVDLSTQAFMATIFHPVAIPCNDQYKFRITRKTLTGSVPQANVYLKQLLYEDNAATFNPATMPEADYSALPPNAVITWSYAGKGAIAYDLEWVYIAGYELFTGTTPQDAFRFKEPVRITTAALSYAHQLYYPSGRVWFRVRAVGYNPADLNHRMVGGWSYVTGRRADGSEDVVNPELHRTWQLQTTFTEEGKYKKLVSYYDGSSRVRQILTNLSTDKRTLVAEQLYDFEGRKALDVLPTPLDGNSLTYKPNLNVFTGTDPLVQQNTSATRKKFHYDNGNRQNSVLANTSGAGQYYSANNPLALPNREKDYMPAANGYAYAQTEYTPDNTGRVTKKSGAGEAFKTDGSRTNRAYFGSAAPAELIRLFGSNVGNASHYKKNLMRDPNGQVSVTYQDQEGRTVANALAGDPPANLDALESYTNRVTAPVTVDITAKNQKTEGVSRLEHKVMNSSPTTYTFQYELAALAAQLQSVGCQECTYDLRIKITGPDGTPVSLASLPGNESTDGQTYARKNLTAACGSPALTHNLTFQVSFSEVGDYTISKEVVPHELTVEQVKTRVAGSAIIQQKITQIRNKYVVDPVQCTICWENCEGAEGEVTNTINEIAALDCENIRQQIIQAVLKGKDPQYEVTDADIQGHAMYCQYELCMKNQESDVFDKQLSLVRDWTTAQAKGYEALIDLDPFFDPAKNLSGKGQKDAMQKKLNSMLVATIPLYVDGDGEPDGGTLFVGSIYDATDPDNTSFYLGDNGRRDPDNGRHLLYYELMGQRASMTPDVYHRKLNEQRWIMFRNLYLENKRQLKLTIAEMAGCAPYVEELEKGKPVDRTEARITEWGKEQNIIRPVSEQQIEMTIANMLASCNIPAAQLLPEDKTNLATALRNYFKSGPSNFFLLIIRKDLLTSPDLATVSQILAKYNCSLNNIAVDDPVACKVSREIPIPAAVHCLECEDVGTTAGMSSTTSDISSLSDAYVGQNNTEQRGRERQPSGRLKLPPGLETRRQRQDSLYIAEKVRLMKARRQKKTKKTSPNRTEGTSPLMNMSQTAAVYPPQAEYDALVALYNATGGPNWRNTLFNESPWNVVPGQVQDVSNWYGVFTSPDGHIFSVDLYNNYLSGSLPENLNQLTHLQDLNLGQNQLTGSIPPSLGEISTLKYLYLDNNQLTGGIPPSLGKLKNLEYLWLGYNPLGGSIPPELGEMNSLTDLWLANAQLTGSIPPSLGKLANLNSLYLGVNAFSGPIPPELGDLKNLRYLLLSRNTLHGPIPSSLGKLSNLFHLQLGENMLRGPIPSELGDLAMLTRLILEHNQLSGPVPPSLGKLSNLTWLNLFDNALSGSVPVELGNLTNLTDLWLGGNDLAGTIPTSFGQLTKLEVLYLAGNHLYGPIPPALGSLATLRSLDLTLNDFSGAIPVELAGSPAYLSMSQNYYTFDHLLPFYQVRPTNIHYEPQKLIDVPKVLSWQPGGSVTFTTNIDRTTSPASKYQWFRYVNGRDDIPLFPEPTYDGHTHTIANLTEADKGIYYYRITNEAVPWLRLRSYNQILTNTRTITICEEYDQANPTLALFSFEVKWSDVMQQCMNQQEEITTVLENYAIDRMLEEEATAYYQAFGTSCLQNLTEKLAYTYENKEYHYTLYYYDQAGNLVQTVPPKGVNPLTPQQVTAFLAGTVTEPAHTLLTNYRYNTYNKLVWQRTPDAGTSEFWYDAKGQLRLSRNAQQAIDGKYAYTRYDEQGRTIEVGELTTTQTPAQLATELDNAAFPQSASFTLGDITRTHYDLPAPGLNSPPPGTEAFKQTHLRSRVSWVEAINGKGANAATVATYYSYDEHGNVKSLQQQLPGTTAKRTDYAYDLISGKVNYAMYQYGQEDQLLHRYGYDADNRLEQVHTSTDGFVWDKDAGYFYYAHGPLARMETGHYKVQGSDYAYTLQGWLKGVNMPYAGDPGKDGGSPGPRTGKDAFAFALGYYQGDYQPISGSVVLSDSRDKLWTRYAEQVGNNQGGLYNGNIGWMVTDLPEVGTMGNDRTKGMQGMVYRYDQLNRITAGLSLSKYGATTGFEARAAGADAPFDTRYRYDPNGNLLTQTRRDDLNTLSDDLKYSYFEGTNRLKTALLPPTGDGSEKVYSSGAVMPDGKQYGRVVLQGPAYVASGSTVSLQALEKAILRSGFSVQGGGRLELEVVKGTPLDDQYVYDAIGNLIEDKGEGTKIEWNVYGKITSVKRGTTTSLFFRYDAAGNRVEKQHLQDGLSTTTRYVRDASGNVMATYGLAAPAGAPADLAQEVMIEQPLYGSSRLGLYRGGRLDGQRRLGYKHYELSNHLGNVLAVVSDNIYHDATNTWVKTLSTTDYYPFGFAMPSRSISSDSYRYGFNGKEKDQEFQNHYDYGFRIYNPRLAKFLSVDPLTQEYPELTPYQFASNTPIFAIDVDGLEALDYSSRYIGFTKSALERGKDPTEVILSIERQRAVGHAIGLGIVLTGGVGVSAAPSFVAWLTRAGLWIASNPIEVTVVGGTIANAIDPNPAADWVPGMPLDNAGNLIGQGFRYLFRGTTDNFIGGATALKEGITYTSLDPLKSTIFAIFSKNKGKPVLHGAEIENFEGIPVRAGNWAAEVEKEVILEILPTNYAEKSFKITLDQARDIFKKMGVGVPDTVEDITRTLKETPDLSQQQIETFYKEAINVATSGSKSASK